MKFKNHYNAAEFPSGNEPGGGVSMTIPDQALSIKDIMRRYGSGLSFNSVKVGEYTGEELDLPDFKKMDLSEIYEFKQWVADNLREKKEKVTKTFEEKKRVRTLEMYQEWKKAEAEKNPDNDKGSANSPVI